MMTKKRMIVGFAATLALAALVMGCGGASALAGKWAAEGGRHPSDSPYIPSDYPTKIALSKDGTGTADENSLTWTAANGRLTLKLATRMSSAHITIEYNYKLSGRTLVLTKDDETSVTYIKE